MAERTCHIRLGQGHFTGLIGLWQRQISTFQSGMMACFLWRKIYVTPPYFIVICNFHYSVLQTIDLYVQTLFQENDFIKARKVLIWEHLFKGFKMSVLHKHMYPSHMAAQTNECYVRSPARSKNTKWVPEQLNSIRESWAFSTKTLLNADLIHFAHPTSHDSRSDVSGDRSVTHQILITRNQHKLIEGRVTGNLRSSYKRTATKASFVRKAKKE